jgi:hypothetical protein
MLDHPVTQKVFATVAAGTFLAMGGVGWNLSHRVTTLENSKEMVAASLFEIKTVVNATRDDTSAIKTDVAVLRERTKVLAPKDEE